MLFKTFSSLLCPPPPPPSSTLTADDFATIFINKMTNLTAQYSTPQSAKHILPANIHSFTCFSLYLLLEVEISKLILSSHPTTCPLDPIPSHLLQAISPAVVPALAHIVNTSLHTSAFKQARITQLLKKPTLNPTILGNYRPVSLLPFIAKHLNELCSTKSLPFSHRTTFWTVTNLAFKSGYSTETALLSVVEDLRLARMASKSSLLILLDLCCFWYGQPPDPPVNPIEKGHLRGTALQWFDSYLSDRSFKVSWRGEVSKSQHLATGVPQGSVSVRAGLYK